jgi:hypothetical protein
MKKIIRRVRKPISELTVCELEAMTAGLDREFIADEFAPPTPGQRKRWNRAKRRLARPRQGAACTPVSVTIEKGLLRRVDLIVKRRRISRSRLIARGLEAIVRGELTVR